jgi:F0F1-type ATP synthase assembly protein I
MFTKVLTLAFELGFIIALPAALGAYGGYRLDMRFQTKPIFTITLLVVAIVVSSLVIYRKIKQIEKK